MEKEVLKILSDNLQFWGWHIGDGVDDCSGFDEDAMDKSLKELAFRICAFFVEVEGG